MTFRTENALIFPMTYVNKTVNIRSKVANRKGVG